MPKRDPQMLIQCDENALISKYSPRFTDPAIMIDNDGVLLKYGDYSMVQKYHATFAAKYGIHHIDTHVIRFNTYGGLSMDDICAIVNYGLNCHSKNLRTMLECSNRQAIRDWINKLKNWGY